MLLENKVAMITGASRGIGKAVALKFAREGAVAILSGRNMDTLKEVQAEIEVFDEICEMDLRTVMLMMKVVLPHMVERKSGSIVNIGSGAAIRGLPKNSAYAAAKAGVVCLTQAVGDEVRPYGVRINAICPGPVDAELFQNSACRDFILSAGGDLFQPEEVANGVLFLASDLSGCTNSQTLIMRGFNRW